MGSIDKWDCPQCEIEFQVYGGGGKMRPQAYEKWIEKEPTLCRNCHKAAVYVKIKPGCQDQVDAWNEEPNQDKKIQPGFRECSCGSKDASLIHYAEEGDPRVARENKAGYKHWGPLCPDCEVPMETTRLEEWRTRIIDTTER